MAPSGSRVPSGAPHVQVAEIQRSRLLAAAVRAVEELGYAGATVSHITTRARVSRRTFYEMFANRDECLAAVLEDVVSRVRTEIATAGIAGLAWRERVRLGLWTILAFFDREPALARICVIQALRGGPLVLELREAVLAELAAAVDEGRTAGVRRAESTLLTAEGLVGATFAIVHGWLLRGERAPLASLLSELMALIVLPYEGSAAARREQARVPPGPHPNASGWLPGTGQVIGDPLEGVSMRLTYRTARVMEGVAEHPGASNRRVAEHAEITDQGQVSKLLSRLERLELLSNRSEGHAKGEPNAWHLTPKGQRVAQSIRMRAPGKREAA